MSSSPSAWRRVSSRRSRSISGSTSARRWDESMGTFSGTRVGGAVHTAPNRRRQRTSGLPSPSPPRERGTCLTFHLAHLLDAPGVTARLERRLEERLHDRPPEPEPHHALADAE